MNTIEPLPFRQWATIDQTEKFISVRPLSGYRRHLPEDDPHAIYLEPHPTDEAVGTAVLKSLSISRFIKPAENRAFFKPERILAADKRWHDEFMKRFGYKTKRQAYQGMIYCLAERSEGKIAITPHRRDKKPGLWWDLPPEKTVVIPATDDVGILGAAAKLALSHCE